MKIRLVYVLNKLRKHLKMKRLFLISNLRQQILRLNVLLVDPLQPAPPQLGAGLEHERVRLW